MSEPRRVALYCAERSCRRLIGYAIVSPEALSIEIISRHGGGRHLSVLHIDAHSGTLHVTTEQSSETAIS